MTHGVIIPILRYRDAPAAIEWLCRAFGFEKRLVVPGEDGKIRHSQLVFGSGMVMLGSHRDEESGTLQRSQGDLGGAGGPGAYIVVPDADAHHARAVAAGARIVQPLQDPLHGGRFYSCLDPEDHPWSFGTYDPWK